MRFPCPACHATITLDAAVEDASARAAFERACRLPHQVGQHLTGYLALFRKGSRGISWARVGRLLDEILPMIESESASRDGVHHRVPVAAWSDALVEVASRRGNPGFDLPLNSHGYLIKVAIGRAHELAALSERQREEDVKRQAQARRTQEGVSPRREIDPNENERMYIDQQLHLGFITEAQHKQRREALERSSKP